MFFLIYGRVLLIFLNRVFGSLDKSKVSLTHVEPSAASSATTLLSTGGPQMSFLGLSVFLTSSKDLPTCSEDQQHCATFRKSFI